MLQNHAVVNPKWFHQISYFECYSNSKLHTSRFPARSI